jgi:S1-C subfamily serine protease
MNRPLRGTLLILPLLLLAACAAPAVRVETSTGTTQAAAPHAVGKAASIPLPAESSGSATGSGALAQFQGTLESIASALAPSIVQIETSQGLGSGIVYDAAGDIVTNAHVVDGASSYTVKTSDGRTFTATLAGTYAGNDLAVVHASGTSGLKPARFADSSQVQVGEVVLAIGSPFGLSGTVTEGIVSATGRTQSEGNGVTLTDLVQTSAPINPGNSGGALVDIAGEVIGIPTLSGSDSQGRNPASAGIGFAIPSNQVVSAARQLVATGSVTHSNRAYLGISTRDDATAGVDVVSVVSGGPAAKAGFQAGWVISAIGGHPVADSNGLTQLLTGYAPGDTVTITVQLPDGSGRGVSVILGERPTRP